MPLVGVLVGITICLLIGLIIFYLSRQTEEGFAVRDFFKRRVQSAQQVLQKAADKGKNLAQTAVARGKALAQTAGSKVDTLAKDSPLAQRALARARAAAAVARRRAAAVKSRYLTRRAGPNAKATTRNEFTKDQKEMVFSNMNKAVYVNSGLSNDVMLKATAALGIADTFGTNRTASQNLTRLFETDPFPGYAEENKQCGNALEPSLMATKERTAKKGCGWWYVDDDNRLSVGAMGTSAGPLDYETLSQKYRGGVWVWNTEEAQKLEDIKRCRKITTCATADLVPGRCGFCPGLNRGIPIDKSRMSLYEEDPNLNCGSAVITSPASCPRPQATFNENGEVTNREATKLVCDANPATGRLTKECLVTLAQGAGCNESGAILMILTGDKQGYLGQRGAGAAKFRIATEYLFRNASIASDKAYFGNGVCTRSEALDYYTRVCRLAITSTNDRLKAAAQFLTTAADEFDECVQNSKDMGPFELHCLERQAREVYCQPAGTDFPKNSNKSTYDNMSWGQVIRYFSDLKLLTKSDDFSTQSDAVKRCLGIDVKPAAADCGDVNGLSMYVYQWNYDWAVASGRTPRHIYYGRISSPTFPEINNNGSYTPFAIGTDRIHMRIKAKITTPKQQTSRFWVMTDDGVTINVDGKTALTKWYDQGPTAYETSQITFNENSPRNITSDWYNNYGGYVAVYRMLLEGRFQPVPPNMITQQQPTGYPFARWDFYEGIIDDRCGTLASQVVGTVSISTIDGKQCALFNGRNHIRILNGIKTTGFKSITMQVFIRKSTQGWPRLWEFNNNGFGGSWCQDNFFGCFSPNLEKGVGFYTKIGCTGPELWSGKGTIKVGKWFHMAWVLDDDMRGMTMYIDGNRAGRYYDSNFVLLQNKIYNNMYIFTSTEQFDKDCGVGWFRMFDYPLSAEDIKTDRMNGWSTKELFPVTKGTGF